MQHHAGPAEQHRQTMLVFSQLQFGVLQTFLTAKKQREEKDQESEIEPGEVSDSDLVGGGGGGILYFEYKNCAVARDNNVT